ncbi:MAG: hypothetical protein PHZ11_10570 [Desulfitobacteriaceae bacterium]|nr:hypothetical protein [Desulfitobacteriaceae bacterium]MDD4347298.1 hypothetical protein [Desulfitobacteriaceae bacterium]
MPQSALGAGLIALILFFLLIFASDYLLSHVTKENMGIAVIFGLTCFSALVILILFIL